MGRHRIDHAKRIGRVSEVRQVAGDDRPVRFAEQRPEARDGAERHVDVAEADETHGAVVATAA